MPFQYTDEPRDVGNGLLARFVGEPAYCQTFSENAQRLEDVLKAGWWLELIAFSYSGYDRQSIDQTALPFVKKIGSVIKLAVRLCHKGPAFDRLHPGIQLRDCFHSPIWLVLHDGAIAGIYQGPMTQRMLAEFLRRIPELADAVKAVEKEYTGFGVGVDRFLQWCGILHDPDWWFKQTRFSTSIDVLGAIYPRRESSRDAQLIE